MLQKVMGFLGAALFLLVFLMITPAFRELMAKVFGGAGDWIHHYAPLSYIILAVATIVPIIAVIVVVNWPTPPPPEDFRSQFRAEDVIED